MTNLFDTYNTELWREFAAETRAHNDAQYEAQRATREQREIDYESDHARVGEAAILEAMDRDRTSALLGEARIT